MTKEITAEEVRQRIEKGEQIQLLDVRSEDAFEDWHIDIPTIKNIPFHEVAGRIDELEQEKVVYTICYRGNSSFRVAAFLEQYGFKSVSIKGGMKGWSAQFKPITVTKEKNLEIIQFQRIGKNCLSYMIISDNQALVVDPSIYTEVYTSFAKSRTVKIMAVVDTHLQADHCSGSLALAEASKAQYYCSAEDFQDATFVYTALKNEQIITLGQEKITVSLVPGHTLGSIVLNLQNKFLFTGDTLFINSVGRPDLAGKAKEWAKNQFHSLQRLLPLKSALVLPSHYAEETEKNNGIVGLPLSVVCKNNTLLQLKTEQEFVTAVTKNKVQQPDTYSTIREINLSAKKPEFEELEELEFGRNQCAASR